MTTRGAAERHPALISAGAALLGALIGGGITLYGEFHLAGKQNAEAREQRRRDRAEEIVTLIEKTPATEIAEKTAMKLEPTHMTAPLTDAERVVALVALYFPNADDLARAYEAASAEHFEMLSEIALATIRHSPVPDDSASFQNVLAKGDLVTTKVLDDVGVCYKPRTPTASPKSCSP